MDIYEANRNAWNNEASLGNFWTLMVKDEQIQKAREGKPEIWVTPFKMVPQARLSVLKSRNVLLACSGGGQQTPILAAFGLNLDAITNFSIPAAREYSDDELLEDVLREEITPFLPTRLMKPNPSLRNRLRP